MLIFLNLSHSEQWDTVWSLGLVKSFKFGMSYRSPELCYYSLALVPVHFIRFSLLSISLLSSCLFPSQLQALSPSILSLSESNLTSEENAIGLNCRALGEWRVVKESLQMLSVFRPNIFPPTRMEDLEQWLLKCISEWFLTRKYKPLYIKNFFPANTIIFKMYNWYLLGTIFFCLWIYFFIYFVHLSPLWKTFSPCCFSFKFG